MIYFVAQIIDWNFQKRKFWLLAIERNAIIADGALTVFYWCK